MKQHLFYTFLVIFAVTTMVTLLGVTGALTIPDNYLMPLVVALVIESAGATIAIFKRSDFFNEETTRTQDELARLKSRNEAMQAQLISATNLNSQLQGVNSELHARLQDVQSIRSQILAIVGSASCQRLTILQELKIGGDRNEIASAVGVIGKLVEEGVIEKDPDKYGDGYYRLRQP